jgi:hypothetical protein
MLIVIAGPVAVGSGHELTAPSAAIKTMTLSLNQVKAKPLKKRARFGLGAAPVIGVDLYAPDNYAPTVVQTDGERTLAYIKNVLKANTVGIVWDFYATSASSDAVETTSSTLSVQDIAILTEIAKQDGLRVEYRPLIFVNTPATCAMPGPASTNVCNTWEGLIAPQDPVSWFASYYEAELPYLQLAQRLRVGEFVTATEMEDLNDSPLWPAFFARVARVYRGTVSYTAWDKDYFNAPGPLLPTKKLGMDMYMALNLPSTATSAQVTAAWEQYFSQIAETVRRRTMIDETGIPARAGAYDNPEWQSLPGVLDEGTQANWYTAACQTVHHYHLRGVFFWKVDLTDNPASPAQSLSTFEGKAGATAISDCAQIVN